MDITQEIREAIVNYCNALIVPDSNYLKKGGHKEHSIEWFKKHFNFIDNTTLQIHLADAFYQSRFVYKLMQGLRLTAFKRGAMIKFQIQQYASIYEAIIDFVLETYYKSEIKELLKEIEYRPIKVLSSNSKFTVELNGKTETIVTCKQTTRDVPLKKTRIDKRTKIAVDLGIISQGIKESIDSLYDLRNNIHILKAASADYRPNINEAQRAFELMNPFVESVKNHLKGKKKSK